MDPSFIGLPVSWSMIQGYGSADPDPKEIFTDPQHRYFQVPKATDVDRTFLIRTLIRSDSRSFFQDLNQIQIYIPALGKII
jgi:hypothetical protein